MDIIGRNTAGGNPNSETGLRISAEDIRSDGTIGGRFTSDGGWATEDGKLPGLSGSPLELPEHLR
ncbi:MAG: hypothetical protein LBC70_05000 [Chitinispirillales bacterium]|nr:hypothetical protein [Chitinispirillales bacterium]